MPKSSKPPSAKQAALISFLVDVSDILLNLMVAILSGSVVMTTQWLQGLADFTSSGLILLGVKNSYKKADAQHPFGYGRELYFWTLLSTVIMLTVTSGLSFYLGWKRLIFPETVTDVPLVVSVLLISVFSNFYAVHQNWLRLKATSKHSNSLDIFFRSSLVEVRTNLILDASGSLASVVGLISMVFYQISGNNHIDGLATVIISIFIAAISLVLLFNLRGLIIGQSVDKQTEKKIVEVIESFPQVIKVLDLRTSIIGPQQFLVNVEIHAKPKMTTKQLEKVIDQIKQKSIRSVPQISHIQVELETPE